MLREGIGGEVEIEFAVDMADWGRDPPSHRRRRLPRMYLLQVRPQASPDLRQLRFDFEELDQDALLCRTQRALGNGLIDDIHDVVYVTRDDVDCDFTRAAVEHIRAMNETLLSDGAPYLLIGPGRWGTSDPNLGIPIEWSGIAGARVIVETPIADRRVEASQGSHFFQNVIAQRMGYLTVRPDVRGYVDREWLDAQPAVRETHGVRHVHLEAPIGVCLDGLKGSAVVLKDARSLASSLPGRVLD